MKKLIFGMVLAVLLAVLAAPIALADDGENVEKAGQQALQEREEILVSEKARLERIVEVLTDDGTVTMGEMISLHNEVNNFNRLKERYDRELKIYGKETSTTLGEGYERAIDAYFVHQALFKRDDTKETVRIFFATKTGQDVVVQRGAALRGGIAIGLFVPTAIFFVLTFVVLGCAQEKRKALIPFIICLFFLGFLLLG